MTLKAPFPYFGGKRRAADIIWPRLGNPVNYIEPFAGSAAMLLCRPDAPRIETLNDVDCYVANFWRATSIAPEAVAFHADSPVNEADLHARHRWLVLSHAAAEFRDRMRRDPDYYDAKVAGWWCWGLCCWIGSGWCSTAAEIERKGGATPALAGSDGLGLGVVNGRKLKQKIPQNATKWANGKGVNLASMPDISGAAGGELSQKLPMLNAGGNQVEATGRGVNGLHEKRPQLTARSERDQGTGVHKVNGENGSAAKQRPQLDDSGGRGVLADTNRPQLADAYARGRGVHGHDEAGTCEQRRRWLLNWFGQLRDRMRTVRVCCGHWRRVCDSHSVTTRLGLTAIFLDPPYPTHRGDGSASRDGSLYATDGDRDELDTIRDDVLQYCRERGQDPLMRICVAGYDTDGYAVLETEGWVVVPWKASGGYGNRGKKSGTKNENAERERLWFSPHCLLPGAGLVQGELFE